MYVFCGLLHPSDKARTWDSGFLEIFIFFREFLWGCFHISLTKVQNVNNLRKSDCLQRDLYIWFMYCFFIILAPEESCWSILLPSNHFMVCSKPGSQRKYTLKSVTKAKMRNVTPEWNLLMLAYVNLFSQHFVKKKSTSRCGMAFILYQSTEYVPSVIWQDMTGIRALETILCWKNQYLEENWVLNLSTNLQFVRPNRYEMIENPMKNTKCVTETSLYRLCKHPMMLLPP